MRKFAIVAAFIILLNFPLYAMAENYTVKTFNIDFEPAGDYDEIVNRAGGEKLNYYTWENIPDGIYAGSYGPESEFALNTVMSYWYERVFNVTSSDEVFEHNEAEYGGKIILAQYVRYTPDIIMSGVSKFYVRLPINASSFSKGVFYIYKVNSINSYFGVSNDSIRSFADSTVFFYTQKWNYPDYSEFIDTRYMPKADGVVIAETWFNTNSTELSQFHPYTRNNRVYVPVTAPLDPNQYYIFVTVAYAKSTISGGSTNIFISQDNISTAPIKSFIGIATDDSIYEFKHQEEFLNVSLGYSIIFNQGYGGGISATWYQFYAGDELTYIVNTSGVNQTGKYATVLFPFVNSGNTTVNASITIDDGYGHTQTKDVSGIDFFLVSFDNSFSSNKIYYRITIHFKNDIKLGLILSIPEYIGNNFLLNATEQSWSSSINETLTRLWNNVPYTTYIKSGDSLNRIFFAPYAPLEFGSGKWNYVIPDSSGKHKVSFWEKLGNYIFCGVTGLYITVVGLTPIGFSISYVLSPSHDIFALAEAGVQIELYQNWNKLVDLINRGTVIIKDVFNSARYALNAIGNFVKKVGYAIKTAITWVVEKITYYGSIILQAISEIIYFIAFIVGIYLWYKFLHWMRLIALGRWQKLADEMEGSLRGIGGIIRR